MQDIETLIEVTDCMCGMKCSTFGSVVICTKCHGIYHPECAFKKYRLGRKPFVCDYCNNPASTATPFVLLISEPTYVDYLESNSNLNSRTAILRFLEENPLLSKEAIKILTDTLGDNFTGCKEHDRSLNMYQDVLSKVKDPLVVQTAMWY